MSTMSILSTSPTAVVDSYLRPSTSTIPLKDFLQDLPKTIEGILEKHTSLEPQLDQKVDPIAELFGRLKCDDLSRYAYTDDSKNYTRNLIATDDKHFSLILLCWNPSKSSPIHDHPCDGCWMRVLEGKVQEKRYRISEEGGEGEGRSSMHCFFDQTYAEGALAYVSDSLGYHSVGNPSSSQKAMTLHLYCPPFSKCRIWMHGKSNCSVSQISFDSEYGTKKS